MPFIGLKRITLSALVLLTSSSLFAAEILVSAASSLTNAFSEIGQTYQQTHPETQVKFNFAASGALLQQLAKGAPVDVFASADQETMAKAKQQRLVTENSANFAQNQLVIIVPTTSQLQLSKLDDLNATQVQRIALGNPDSVPAGRYSQSALQKNQQWSSLAPKLIQTQNVRQALDYVARGEVDVGFVYATDAKMSDKVKIALSVQLDHPIHYPIAQTLTSAEPKAAQSFIEFVLSPKGQEILARYGFRQP